MARIGTKLALTAIFSLWSLEEKDKENDKEAKEIINKLTNFLVVYF